ncbi:MAG: M1 family metallopeptidase [Candidatus Saccharimonadales bacterium]
MTEVARLYQLFKPSRYELHITPNKQALTFSGSVTIEGTLSAKQNKLRLHAKELVVTEVAINATHRDYALEADNDELVIELKDSDKGTLRVSIEFEGTITKPMHGLYPCYARNGDVILATQFESHHAREVFPCVDEPEAKAIFSLSLTIPTGDVALANTEPSQAMHGPDFTTTVFEDTPVMSTYLLAFVTGPLHAVEGETKNGTKVRVWASADHADDTMTFALDTGIRATEFFNDYFDTPYPLTKCDHVALPDFSSGAMENWGLITYREVCLIVDPQTTSTNTKEYAATVIAHELSHQWFGNLVTMKWWDDLWLNESFATLMEYVAVDALYPEWNVMLSFASQEALSAFWRDSIPGVQAVKCTVNHPDEISTLFDPSIVYAKGARLLLMAHNFVGKNNFRKGLRLYFKRFAYSNTKGNDLWQALEDASGKKVRAFMNDWIETNGFPLVRVSQDGKKLALSQERFSDITATADETTWPVPLNLKPEQTPEIELFTTRQKSYVLASSRYVRLNTEGAHYSVRYESEAHRKHLETQLGEGKIRPRERLFILNDSLMQARAGYGSIAETMEILDAMKNETEDPVWVVMSMCMGDARTLVDENEHHESHMKQFSWQLVAHQYKKLGWKKRAKEDLTTTKMRGIILGLAAYSEEQAVIDAALKEYNSYDSLESMPADTRHIVLSAAVRHGGDTVFKRLFELYPTIANSELQQDVCNALTSTRDEAHIKLLLSRLKDESFVRLQDFDRWVIYLLRNRKGRTATWNWFTKNWPWIVENFGSDKSFDNYPRFAGRVFGTEAWLTKYNTFFEPLKSEIALRRNIEIGAEEIKARIAWKQRDEQALEQWLSVRFNQSK